MAVEARGGGGVISARELLKHDELEAKKEREMGGDFEHIARREGEDYDSNETEGSFVMVKSGADSDGRSDTSEKEIELDADGGVGDPPDASNAPSTFVDYERVVEGKIENKVGREEKGDKEVGDEVRTVGDSPCSENEEIGEELAGEGEQVQIPEVMHVTREEDIVDSTRTDIVLKEDDVLREFSMEADDRDQKEISALKEPKDDRGTVIEDLSEAEGMTVDVSKNKEDVIAVEDSNDKEVVSEDLNNEKEAVPVIQEQVFEGEAPYVQNEAGILCEGLTIRLDSSPITSSVDSEHEVKSVFKESEDVESSVIQPKSNEVEAVSEIEEREKLHAERSGDGEVSLTGKKEIDFALDIEERRDANDELEKDIVSLVSEPEKEENLTPDLEDEMKINDEKSEDVELSIAELTEHEGSKEAETSITDHAAQVGIAFPDGSGNIANDNLAEYGHVENEGKSAVQEDEKQQNEVPQINFDSVHNDVSSFVEQVQQKDANASLLKPASEAKEDDSFTDLIALPEKENICSSLVIEQYPVAEGLSVGPIPVNIDKAVCLASQADNEHAEAFSNDNKQRRNSPTYSDSVDRDLRLSVEQAQQQEVDIILPKSDSVGKEHESSTESETVMEKLGSSSIFEEYQIIRVSSINQSPETGDHDVDLSSRMENKHVEALPIETHESRTSLTGFNSVDRNLMQDADTSLPKSDSEEKEHNSSLELIAESVKENFRASSIVEQYLVAEASSVVQFPVIIDKGLSLASLAVDNPEAISTVNQIMQNLPTESEAVDIYSTSYVGQVQQQDVDVSHSKSNCKEKEHDSSNESITGLSKETNVSLMFKESQVAEIFSNDQSPDHVNEDVCLAFKEKDIEPLSIKNCQNKDTQTDFDNADRNLESPVECLQPADASLSKSNIEEKGPDSYIELITEPANESINSFSTDEYPIVEASSICQTPESINIDDSLASRIEDNFFETLSIHNQQSKALLVDSCSIDRDLGLSVEKVQQQEVDSFLAKSSIEENKHDSSTVLISETLKENIDSSSTVEDMVLDCPTIACPESFNDDAKLASEVDDKLIEALSMENQKRKALLIVSDSVDRSYTEQLQQEDVDACLSKSAEEEEKPDSCIELVAESVSSSVFEKYQDLEASPFGKIPEYVKEDVNLTSPAEDKHIETLFIEGNLIPSREELVLATEVDEDHDEVPSIYLKHELEEERGLPSDPEEKSSSESFMNKGFSERMELQPATELAVLEAQLVEDLKGVENQQNDLKLVKKHDTEDTEKRELESATVIEEHPETHIDKDLGTIKEHQEEFKSQTKQAAVHIEQYQGSSTTLPSEGNGEKTEMHTKKYYIIKVPRFTQRVIDNDLQQKLLEAQMKVDENTRIRDSIKVELENMRKVLSDCCHKRDSAIEEEKKARILVNAKRQEMDSLQSVISKGKTAASFLDIASQINTLAHKIQHETISLKEEKKFIHELKQLEIEQEQHLFCKCSQQEIDEILKMKETAESSLKDLKKEFDLLRSAHIKADEFAKSASKNYTNQFNQVKEHEKKWRAANNLRQTAYKDLHGLKSDKMDHFWRYMDDRQAARKYASSRDIDVLERHCTEQIDRILQLWKEDEDFRRQYIESNVNSTLRRFGTIDGRSVGMNEEAVALPSRIPAPSTARSLAIPVKVQEVEFGSTQEINRPSLQPKKIVRSSKPSSKSTSIESTPTIPAIVSVKEEIVEAQLEKKPMEEEVQVRLEEERKDVELRKEKVEVELKEKIRMEQKAKAKEAEERKRRKSEKAQARADYKAQKAAELREQKRVKKEKKKEDSPETTGSMECEDVSVTEISSSKPSQEPERSSKRPTRQSAVASNKYSGRHQPVPLPLRNKGRRKTSMLVWTLCGAVAVGGLLFAGTYIPFSNISLVDFGF